MSIRALRITVDLEAIAHNFLIARQLEPQQKLFAVIKADAYGHGAVAVAEALSQPSVSADGFAVVTIGEALELRTAGIVQPILVLQGPQSSAELSTCSDHELWPVIHAQHQLEWLKASSSSGQLQAWLKVDTGMGRLGFSTEDASNILNQATIKWRGALTHFASADAPNKEQTLQQINSFNTLCAEHKLDLSLANSAGLLAWPRSFAHWGRPGIMLYGSDPVTGKQQVAGLRSAMRVSAPIIAIKRYRRGSSIGYFATYQCPEDMPIGYAAIGYGDGLPRVIDTNATVFINGKLCPIVGRVSMDSIAVDLRQVPETTYGDQVVVFGPEHPAESLAASANTTTYELFTSIRGDRNYV